MQPKSLEELSKAISIALGREWMGNLWMKSAKDGTSTVVRDLPDWAQHDESALRLVAVTLKNNPDWTFKLWKTRDEIWTAAFEMASYTASEHYMYHSYSAADLADAIARAW